MTRIVAAFNMLKEDMLHLSEIAGRLRQKAAVQKERSEIGAEQVGLIYESNDKLSSRGEAVAQTARGGFDTAQRILEAAQQYESEMQTVRERVQTGRDHIDKLFHKLVQVKAAMTAVRNITEKISAVSQAKNTSETQVEDMLRLARLGEEATLQYDHMEVTVEELTTAIYNITQVMTLFQEKVEMSFNMTRQISKSTHALQEENSSTAQAIEDMVMEMHKNQRQAMDLLSSLEFARNASQEAIGVLESSARHIVRTEQLVGEMETRLMRFNV
jgi:chromosome segregation ATPase